MRRSQGRRSSGRRAVRRRQSRRRWLKPRRHKQGRRRRRWSTRRRLCGSSIRLQSSARSALRIASAQSCTTSTRMPPHDASASHCRRIRTLSRHIITSAHAGLACRRSFFQFHHVAHGSDALVPRLLANIEDSYCSKRTSMACHSPWSAHMAVGSTWSWGDGVRPLLWPTR